MGKHKGFGQKRDVPIRATKDFILAFGKLIEEGEQDPGKIQHFIAIKVRDFGESLLESLPKAFNSLIADQTPEKRQYFADKIGDLGVALCKSPLGERWLNLELAILVFNLVLKVYTHENFSEKWARTQNNLANAYTSRIRGERADNIEQAITACELALQVYNREDFSEDWAMAHNNLANAYIDRIRGERAENIEQAIAACQLALQVYTRKELPEKWAGVHMNLAKAYWNRVRGDRADNIEQAIATCQLALQVYTRKDFPEKWADAQGSLATAHRDRLKGNPPENLEIALDYYNLSSQIFTRFAYPQKWATNQSNLAEALMKRASLNDDNRDLDRAVMLLREALEELTPRSPDYIDAQYRLGNALSRRHERSQDPNDLEQALQAYKIALDAISPEHYDRQQIWQAIPTTQSILGTRLVRQGEWQAGLELLLNAVQQLRNSDDRLAYANALYQTGRAHEVLTDWSNARLYYRDALRLYEHLGDPPGIAKSRAGLGSVLVSQGHLEKGMAELSKARDLYHQLQKPDKADEVERLYQAAQRANQRILSEVFQ